MVDLGVEDDFGRGHGVVIGEEEFGVEVTAFVAGAVGAWVDGGVPSSFMKKCL